MGVEVKMKLFSYFALIAGALAGQTVVIDENGLVAYVDDAERGSAPKFGPPAKGPRECNGVKIPTYKHGKYHCKPVPKNKGRGKKKKCVFKCDAGYKVQWKNMARTPKSQRTAASSASPARDGSPSQRLFLCQS